MQQHVEYFDFNKDGVIYPWVGALRTQTLLHFSWLRVFQ